MKRGVCLLLFCTLAGIAQADQTLFYGGDPDFLNGLNSTRTPDYTANAYDDFDIGPGGAVVTGLQGDFGHGNGITQAEFEIRSGVSEGNGGVLVASGFSPASGTWEQFADHYLISISGLSIPLAQGRYWVSMAPVSQASGAYIGTTEGVGAIGSPIRNGDAFWTMPALGYYFISASDNRADGPGLWDFSYRVIGSPTPEPLSLASVIIGLVGLRGSTKRARTLVRTAVS